MVGPLRIQSNDVINQVDQFASNVLEYRIVKTKRKPISKPIYGLHKMAYKNQFGDMMATRSAQQGRLYDFNDLSYVSSIRRFITPSINTPTLRNPFGLMNVERQYIDQSPTRRKPLNWSSLYPSNMMSEIHDNFMNFIKRKRIGGKRLIISGKRIQHKICYRIEEMNRHTKNMEILYKLLADNKHIDDLSERLISRSAILLHLKQHLRTRDKIFVKCISNKKYNYVSQQCYVKNVKNHDIYPWMDMHHTKFGRVSDECLKLPARSA